MIIAAVILAANLGAAISVDPSGLKDMQIRSSQRLVPSDPLYDLGVQAVERRQWHKALGHFQSVLAKYPSNANLVGDVVDVALIAGEDPAAYSALESFLSVERARLSDSVFARISLVLSKRGIVVPEDHARLEKLIVINGYVLEHEIRASLPPGRTPREVELMSWIAVGKLSLNDRNPVFPLFYLSSALRLDRENPIAAYYAGFILMREQDYKNAVGVMRPAVKRASGGLRETLLAYIAKAESKADRGRTSTAWPGIGGI